MPDIMNLSDDDPDLVGKDPESLSNVTRVTAKELAARLGNGASGLMSQLTNWKKEPTVRMLKLDLEAAKPFRDTHVSEVQRWDTARSGGKPVPKRRGRSVIRPKLVRRQAEWRYSALSEPFLSSENIFEVNPRTFEDTDAAVQHTILLNWQMRTKIDLVRFVGEAVRTFVDEGTLILRPGWRREIKQVQVERPVYQYMQVMEGSQEEGFLKEALALRDTDPFRYEQLPEELLESINYGEQNGVTAWAVPTGQTQTVTEDKIIKNEPTLDIVDYRNIYIDPSCGNDPERASFIVYSFETSKAELLRDKRYKGLNAVNYGNADLLSDTDHGTETPQDFNFSDEPRKRIIAYEYWGMYDIDGTGELVPIVATWIGDQMIRLERNPYPDKKIPFIFESYSPRKRNVYGEPDAEMLEDSQAISGALTRGMIDLMGRSANSQQGIQKGMLDVTNRRRYQSGEDYEFNPNSHPSQGIINHMYPEIPQSALTLLQMQNYDAEALSGIKAFSGGLSGENYGKVAAGIQGLVDATSKREMDILRRMAECFKRAGAKIISMNQVFLSDKEVVRVTNNKFIEVRRDDLEGQFDLILDISTPETDERKAQDLAFILQTVGPDMDFPFRKIILSKIAKLRKMPDLEQEIKMYEPQPDPIEQARRQLEVSQLELENTKIQAQIAEIQAKTEKLNAEADSIDVDTENNISGATHAQDMERQTEQSRGNQDLAITRALTTPRKEGESEPDVEAAVGFTELSKRMAAAGNRPATAPAVQPPPLTGQ
jgi:hypothetical protein